MLFFSKIRKKVRFFNCCNISLNGAVLPGRNDLEMGPVNSLHAWRNTASNNARFILSLVCLSHCKCNCFVGLYLLQNVKFKKFVNCSLL